MRTTYLAAACALLLAGPALAQGMEPAKTADTARGKTLVDARGMTLYTFDRDASGKSACNGQCATNWPPLMARATARDMGSWSVVTRDDGTRQWAYKAKPLYTFARDSKAGEVTGDGLLQGAWHVATP